MIKNSTDSEMLTPIAIGFQLNFNILFYKNKHYMIVQFLTFHWQNRESLQKKKYFEQSISNAKVGIYTCIFFDNIFLSRCWALHSQDDSYYDVNNNLVAFIFTVRWFRSKIFYLFLHVSKSQYFFSGWISIVLIYQI